VSSIKGTKQLNARLRAIKQTFKPAGRAWADETVKLMRPAVPQRTGRLRRSFRVKNSTQRKATVAGHYSAYFVDKGPKSHNIKPRKAKMLSWRDGGQTIFAKRVHHPGYRGQPFRQRAAEEALRREPLAAQMIDLWNKAA